MSLGTAFAQLKAVLIPVISRNLERVPIPRLAGSNQKYDIALENLVLNGSALIPATIDLKLKSKVEMDMSKLSRNAQRTIVSLEV